MLNNDHLWTVIMAGGLGSRFWPISQTDFPKQFLDVMGVGKSMLQATFERFAQICLPQHIIIVTGEHYVDRVREQLPDLLPYQVLAEPLRRNTAPCIAYASQIISRLDPEATIIVSPSDHAIFHHERFVDDIAQAVQTVARHDWIVTLGVQPTRPDASYGYIQFHAEPSIPQVPSLHRVVTFTEKPPIEMARQFIASGEFFWNTGIFVWRLGVLREAYQKYLPQMAETFFSLAPDTPWSSLERVYSQCESISVDNGIMEKAANVHVLEASFGWSDVETWAGLYDIAHHDPHGNAVIAGDVFLYNTRGTLVSMPNDPGKTVVLEGLEDYIVAASDDTLLVCRRQSEELIFKFSSDVELKRLIDHQ
ncbi:MAG: mannose-1-phosphate guanylyltransferase [Bacteroidales bacterium]|nr:mannose-1-phosphate guanylyltransferase [Bacteroidales bacterium]